jgi:hypothetical protein
MATLSLKRAKPIGDAPTEDLTGRFVVMRQARSTKSFRFTCFHETKDLAQREASRLAKASPGERYLVLQIL